MSSNCKELPSVLVLGALAARITKVPALIRPVSVEYPGKSAKVSFSCVNTSAMSWEVVAFTPFVRLNGPLTPEIFTNLTQ